MSGIQRSDHISTASATAGGIEAIHTAGGNVCFASANAGWSFTLHSFAKLYVKLHGIPFDVAKFASRLWGDIYIIILIPGFLRENFLRMEGIDKRIHIVNVYGMGAVHWVVMSKGALLMIIPHASTPALQVFSPLSRVWPAVARNREVKKEWPAVTCQIDEDILLEVIKMGFDRSQLTESLCSRVQNEATIAYYFLMDNRFRATSGYLGAEFQESMDFMPVRIDSQ
ncbi:hypothetical protein IFM89_007841 [Coptis chinensis]|uniref:UBA domain-containing protein n=1 Tax=Coptis chinensis TaxID=261450 RepID=A0A835GXW2_9MAGN|nr:hypothetical protein IFM89_007841 [Coptis chinensis]